MLIYFSLALIAYACISLVLPLKCRWFLKLPLCAFIILAGAKPWIYNYTGTWLDPNLPFVVIVGLEALYGSLIIAVFIALLKDLCLAGYFVCTLVSKDRLKWPVNLITLGVALVALGQGFYGTFTQFALPEAQLHPIRSSTLPDGLNGTRIIQLTDLHIGPLLKREFLDKVVRRVNELEPDVVLITGDFLDGSLAEIKDDLAPLGQLKAKLGVYAVTGNHEYYSNFRQWGPYLTSLNVRFLNNEGITLQRGGAALNIAGIPDRNGARYGFAAPDVERALSGLPQAFTVLLSHRPDDGAAGQADLILSGHTHGGSMFFLQPLIAHFNGGFVSGMYQLTGDRKLYVSNGTGVWSGFSCRFAVDPEITGFLLVKTEDQDAKQDPE